MTWKSARCWILAVVAALLLPLAVPVVKNARVRHAIHRITARGGMVLSWDQCPEVAWVPVRFRPRARDLYVLRASYDVRLGDPEIGCGTGISLAESDETPPAPDDETLAALPALANIVRLDVRKAAVTDAGLRHVGALSNLLRLTLARTPVTGAGLAHLRGLHLTQVSLEGSPVDDAGLGAIDDLPFLETLDLSGTRVTGPGLSNLARLPALTSVNLSRTAIDDAGLYHLAKLRLRWIRLVDTAVSDAGLAQLERLAGLEYVQLCGTRVTPEAVARSPSPAVRESLRLCNL
jgi:hypothetical protein